MISTQNLITWIGIKKHLLVFIEELLTEPNGVFSGSVIPITLERELKAAISNSNNENNLYISVCTIGNLWDCCDKLGLFSNDTIEEMYNVLGNYRMNYRCITKNRSRRESFRL